MDNATEQAVSPLLRRADPQASGKGVLVSVNASLDSLTPTATRVEVLGAAAKRVYDRAQRG
ncbi:hypothetical protein [Streptomyces axinellae]|uniref:hypothetical protein n=1 Tax=Streptomyces axinellae TaxID=552788 RepID=UPI0031D8AE3F